MSRNFMSRIFSVPITCNGASMMSMGVNATGTLGGRAPKRRESSKKTVSDELPTEGKQRQRRDAVRHWVASEVTAIHSAGSSDSDYSVMSVTK